MRVLAVIASRPRASGYPITHPAGQKIRDLAACPNVHIKLGGLAYACSGFTHHLGELAPSSEELAAGVVALYRQLTHE